MITLRLAAVGKAASQKELVIRFQCQFSTQVEDVIIYFLYLSIFQPKIMTTNTLAKTILATILEQVAVLILFTNIKQK